MAKLPKFEDWTPPWGDDDANFDAEKAKRRVYDLLADKEKLQDQKRSIIEERDEAQAELATAKARLAEKPGEESAKDSKITELTAELEKLKKDGRPEDSSLITRLQVAMDHGLTKQDARRLVGDTPEELEADAADLAQRLGIKKDAEEEQDSSRPPSRRPAPSETRTGSRSADEQLEVDSPEKALERLPSLL